MSSNIAAVTGLLLGNDSEPAPVKHNVNRIVVDPISRIEGHLRIEVKVVDGVVADAWSTGTLFRGVENILQGRNPADAWLFTQRLCGVCTYVHGASSVRAVERALGITIPENARIIRNLLMGAQYLHDHLVHFYHLHALDWVDIVSALSADPGRTQELATQLSPKAPAIDFASVQSRLGSFAGSGQLGPFAQGFWGHPAYQLTPEENLLLAAHYLAALKQQVETAQLHAIFGGKNPHPQSLVVGGVTCDNELNSHSIEEFRRILLNTRDFITQFYTPDLLLVASRYPQWAGLGGTGNYLACGDFPMGAAEPESLYMPQGIIFNRGKVRPMDQQSISEHVAHSWYEGEQDRHPYQGETNPQYTSLDVNDRYSWLKAPRYFAQPMEVGPLARVLVAYYKDVHAVDPHVDHVLKLLNLQPGHLHSTLGRTAARGIETVVLAYAMEEWLDELAQRVAGGDSTLRRSWTMPGTAQGYGFNEAPRGTLGHWIKIENGRIGNYQMVVPSTWNLGPRCAKGLRGPVEQALIGTPVADPSRPLEVLRTVHSFDPCLACAVHTFDPHSQRSSVVRVI